MRNKIILGSANFNQIYGIKKNFIREQEIKKLFNFAWKNKIRTIDTSPLYNQSEKIIGSLNKNRFKIISKVPKIPLNIKRKNIEKWIKQTTIHSLKNLKIKRFECLLLHNTDCLLGKNGNEIYQSLKNIKKKKMTKQIGISIYDYTMLKKIIKKFKFDLIQAPLNILDQRLVKSGWLQKLKNKKIKVHARSIFLQGVLLLKHNKLPKRLKKLTKSWIVWEKWLKKNKLTPLKVCLASVFSHNNLDGVVVGYNSTKQLKQILKLKDEKKKLFYS